MKEIQTLSLVIPIYNEEEVIPFLREATENWRKGKPYEIELILANDGSKDKSALLLDRWAKDDGSIRVIHFSRNFGHQAALTAGLDHAKGDVIITIDADLQDPLEVIDLMVKEYETGADIVYARRKTRDGETFLKKITAKLFYRVLQWSSETELQVDVGDFRLLSRQSLNTLQQMREYHRYLRGMISWIGFNTSSVYYERKPRIQGSTKYNWVRMFGLAWNALMSFSTLPIRLIGWIGVLTAFFGFSYGAYAIGAKFIWGSTVPGWTGLVVLIAITGGINLIGMSVLGQYLARIYEATKQRPLYVIQSTRNT